jgi:hypothetical protein
MVILQIVLLEAVQNGLALIFRDSFFISRDLAGGIKNHWSAAHGAYSKISIGRGAEINKDGYHFTIYSTSPNCALCV